MAKVTPFFTGASNRICSWPLALAECIQGGFCVSRKEKRRGMSSYQGVAISAYSVIPESSCSRIKKVMVKFNSSESESRHAVISQLTKQQTLSTN